MKSLELMMPDEYEAEMRRRNREIVKSRVDAIIDCVCGVLMGIAIIGALIYWDAHRPRMTAEEAQAELDRRAAEYQRTHPEEGYVK